MAWTQLNVSANSRRPTPYREVRADALPPIGLLGGVLFIRKQPVQNPPQFSGTITPAGIRKVFLRQVGKIDFLDMAVSDASGYFEFKGIYSELVQYEYVIIDNDGTVSRAFHVDYPAYSRWIGNPTVNDSSGLTRV